MNKLNTAILLLSSLTFLTACNKKAAIEEGFSASGFTKAANAKCSSTTEEDIFAGGSGTVGSPFKICNEKQYKNISMATYDEDSPYLVTMPYMNSSIVLLNNMKFDADGEKFITLGSYKDSIEYSCDEGYILPEDCLSLWKVFDLVVPGNQVDTISLEAGALADAILNIQLDLKSGANTFSKPYLGQSFDGNGYTIDAGGTYYPQVGKYIGLIGVVEVKAAGFSLKDLSVRNLNIVGSGMVNSAILVGSIFTESGTDGLLTLTTGDGGDVSLTGIRIEDSSIRGANQNSGGLVGTFRVKDDVTVDVSDITFENVDLYGDKQSGFGVSNGDPTRFRPADEWTNYFQYVGNFIGYFLMQDSTASFKNIVINDSLHEFTDLNPGGIQSNAWTTWATSVGFGGVEMNNDGVFEVDGMTFKNPMMRFTNEADSNAVVFGYPGFWEGVASVKNIVITGADIKFNMVNGGRGSWAAGFVAGEFDLGASAVNVENVYVDGKMELSHGVGHGEVAAFAEIDGWGSTALTMKNIYLNTQISLPTDYDSYEVAALAGGVYIAAGDTVNLENIVVPKTSSVTVPLGTQFGGVIGYARRGSWNLTNIISAADLTGVGADSSLLSQIFGELAFSDDPIVDNVIFNSDFNEDIFQSTFDFGNGDTPVAQGRTSAQIADHEIIDLLRAEDFFKKYFPTRASLVSKLK